MSKPNGKPPLQAMLNLRVLKALSLFASKDETRYVLQGVCIELEERGATYIGTDGHRLIAFRDDLAPDDDDNTLTGVFIVPTPHCKHFKLDKEDDGRAVLSGADAGRITIAHGFTDMTFMPIDGDYPYWRKSLPQGTPSGKLAQFNVSLLYDLRKLTKELGLSEPFIAHNGEAPAFIWFSGHPQVFGVMMPIKLIDELHREPPQWVRRGLEREQGDVEDEPLFTEEFDPQTGELPPEKPAKPPKKSPAPAHTVACAAKAEVIRSEPIAGWSSPEDPTPATSFGAVATWAPIQSDGAGPGETLACRGAEPTSGDRSSDIATHSRLGGQHGEEARDGDLNRAITRSTSRGSVDGHAVFGGGESAHAGIWPAGVEPGPREPNFGSLPIARIEPAASPLCPDADNASGHRCTVDGTDRGQIGGAKNGVGDGAASCELKAPTRDPKTTSPAHARDRELPRTRRAQIAGDPSGPEINTGVTSPGRAALILGPRRMWRWEPRLKIVLALREGQITLDDVLSKCRLSAADITEWQERYAAEGVDGLKYRRPPKNRRPPKAYPRGDARAA